MSIGDDAALFRPTSGCDVVLTCDWFLEGTHFLTERHPPASIGWKCLARAVSDIAAMGGVPKCFLLSLALPTSHTGRWLTGFLQGLNQAARQFRCPLAGGDTTRRKNILINVTVVGVVKTGFALHRSGGKPGDIIYVSGTLGEAELGLRLLRDGAKKTTMQNPLLRKHLYPKPRLKLGEWLAEKKLATSAMDLSDGLSSDLPRLCDASGVGATVNADQLPKVYKSFLTDSANALQLALHGGDDYELLFTVSPNQARKIPRAFRGVALTAIGEVTNERRLLLASQGKFSSLAARGWDPFRLAKKK